MHVVMKCPCGAGLKAPVKYVGRELKCPKCSTMLIVPAPPTAATSQPVEPQLEVIESPDYDPLAPLPGSAPLQPLAPQATFQRPTAHKTSRVSSGRGTSLPLIIGLAALGLAIFGGVIWYMYSSQTDTLSSKRGIRVGGQQVDMDMLRERAKTVKDAPPPKEPEPNQFDSGSNSFGDMSSTVSQTDLSTTELTKVIKKSIVRIKVQLRNGTEGIGSGFFIDTEGKIVTNFHVVRGASKVTVTTADDRTAESPGYLLHDQGKDLAIIQVDPSDFDIVPIAIATEIPEQGEKVVAFGAPQGFGFSVTEGIVSGIRTGEEINKTLMEMNRSDEYTGKGYKTDTNWIQSSAAISGGNSGGPLVNLKGELIGVNTWTHRGGQNLNFASVYTEIGKVFGARDNKLRPYLKPFR